MLKAKDYRQLAWAALSGKWDKFAVITLVYVLITGAAGALARYYVGVAIEILVSGALILGISITALAVVNGGEINFLMLFNGFNQFGKATLLFILNAVFILLWTLLLIVPGIIKSLAYSMSYYVLAENPELSANDARKESMELMNGNKWRLFCLSLSFIGWYLLGALTLGILLIWVIPYSQTAVAEFYNTIKLSESSSSSQIAEQTENI